MQRFLDFLTEQTGITMRLVAAKDVAPLLAAHHYLGRMPRATKVVAAAYKEGNPDPIAAVFFGIPARKWPEPVLELTRLVRAPNAPMQPTQLVSFAANAIKQDKTLPQLLISYADPAAGHHGGVYQSASWNYHAKQKDYVDGAHVNGEFIPWRTLHHRYGSSSAKQVQLRNPDLKVEPHTAEGKHLYWRALDNRAEQQAKRLGLQKNPYPKPGQSS